jgi:hypothetical protein
MRVDLIAAQAAAQRKLNVWKIVARALLLFPSSQRRMDCRKDRIRQLVRRGLPFMTPLQGRPRDSPTDHCGLQLGAINPAISQPFQQKLADAGLYLGFDHWFKLPLMFLATRGDLGQEIAGREDQLPQSRCAGPFAPRHASSDECLDSFAHHGFQQGEFIGEMIVKGGPVKRGAFGDVLHRDKVESLFRQKVLQSLKKHLSRTADARIDLRWRLDGHATKSSI